jgi:hypothetical protein
MKRLFNRIVCAVLLATTAAAAVRVEASAPAVPKGDALRLGESADFFMHYRRALKTCPTIRLDPSICFYSAGKWWYIQSPAAVAKNADNVQTFVQVRAGGSPLNGVRVNVYYRRAGTNDNVKFYGANTSGKGYWITDVKTGKKFWFQKDGVAPFNPFYLPKGTWEMIYLADNAVTAVRTIKIS